MSPLADVLPIAAATTPARGIAYGDRIAAEIRVVALLDLHFSYEAAADRDLELECRPEFSNGHFWREADIRPNGDVG